MCTMCTITVKYFDEVSLLLRHAQQDISRMHLEKYLLYGTYDNQLRRNVQRFKVIQGRVDGRPEVS